MQQYRYTVDLISGGQARAYGPTTHKVQVLFELRTSWGPEPRGEWRPYDELKEENVRQRLTNLQCGFTEFTYPPKEPTGDAMGDYYRTRLVYLKKVGPGLWEFETSAEYTD